jgi:hypothetical protein
MFKSLTSVLKSENAKWLFVAIIVCIISYSLWSYSTEKKMIIDGMHSNSTNLPCAQPNQQLHPAEFGNSPTAQTPTVSDYTLAKTNDPEQLLPNDDNSKFGELNPMTNDGQQIPDLLNAVSRIGLDTIGQTMKNPNLQLRSDPTIEKQNIGPWNNSTYEPDLARVPLELGCATK